MAAVVGTVGINIRYCCCLSGRSCCCCLHLAKTDQATCRPMVSIRSMQQSNERIYPRPRLEIWSLMTCPSSTRHRAHRASADVYSQTYNQRITPALLPSRVSPTYDLPYNINSSSTKRYEGIILKGGNVIARPSVRPLMTSSHLIVYIIIICNVMSYVSRSRCHCRACFFVSSSFYLATTTSKLQQNPSITTPRQHTEQTQHLLFPNNSIFECQLFRQKKNLVMLRILLSLLLLAVPVNGFTASNTRTRDGRSSRWMLSSTPTTTAETPKIVNGDATVAVAEISNVELAEQVESAGVTIFEAVASRAASCLFESDKRRDAKGKASGTSASSATNWIDDATAFSLQRVFDRIRVKVRN
jgi:hypothetical protein